jgi:hypothetical protein
MFEELNTEPSLGVRIIPIALGVVAAVAQAHYDFVGNYIVPAVKKDPAYQTALNQLQEDQLARASFDKACRQAITQYLKRGTMDSVEVPLPPAGSLHLACTVTLPQP